MLLSRTEVHDVVVEAMNEQLDRQSAKETLKQSLFAALAAVEPKMTPPAVESQIKTLQERQIELIGLAMAEGAKFVDYDKEIGRVNMEKLRLFWIRAELERAEQTTSAFDHRMEEIDEALDQYSGIIDEYDDIRARELISSIKVLSKKNLLIRFESVQHIEESKIIIS